MKKRTFGVSIFSLVTLVGCGSESTSTTFTVKDSGTIAPSTLTEIRHVCPGLDKYAGQFKNVRVENLFRESILFDIPERARIPGAYAAGGHTCYLELDPDNTRIFIEKMACKSVCLDQVNTPDGQLQLALTRTLK